MLASMTDIQEDNLLQNSAAYLQSWLDCMKEDKRFILGLLHKQKVRSSTFLAASMNTQLF